jgi:hypothetical protein
MFSSRSRKAAQDAPAIRETRDRAGFDAELDTLLRGRERSAANNDDDLDAEARAVSAANDALEQILQPLFANYAELMEAKGRQCEFKLIEGSAETFPHRRALAEFYFGLLGVPGLSECFIRFESEGDDWLITSRPRLDGKGSRYDTGKKPLKSSGRFASEAEAALQQFLRLAI